MIEGYLENLSFSEEPQFAKLVGAMRYSLLAGGERLRPVLCMEVARSFGLDPAEVLPSAAAIELVHTASLIHDGLSIADSGRHQGPTPACHEKFGDATAILAGDAFFGESVILISTHQKGAPERILMVVGELAAAAGAGGMIGGRALGIVGNDADNDPASLRATHDRETGALIEASARIGAILAGAPAKEREHVSEYARQFGLCSRIASDILKASGEDAANRKGASFVRVCGLAEAGRLADEALRGALKALDGLGGDTRGLAEMARLARSGSS